MSLPNLVNKASSPFPAIGFFRYFPPFVKQTGSFSRQPQSSAKAPVIPAATTGVPGPVIFKLQVLGQVLSNAGVLNDATPPGLLGT